LAVAPHNFSESDLELDGIVNFVTSSIAETFHPKSIIVAGSVGRQEFSCLKEDGTVKFLSDCEITVVPHGFIQKEALKSLTQCLSRKTRLELTINSSIKLWICSVLNAPYAVSRRIWQPSIRYYDLKYSSKVVFGKNILQKLPAIQPSDIPVWEGIKLIFNRMAGSLRNYPGACPESYKSFYWINKVILACQDALLLTLKKYHPSYRVRNRMFQQVFHSEFAELSTKVPSLLELATKATDFKLKPSKNAYPSNLHALWFDTVDICDQVFRYVLTVDAGLSFSSWAGFTQKYLTNPKLKRKYNFELNPFLLSNTSGDSGYSAAVSKLIPCCGFNSLKQHTIYSVIPLVYFGLSRNGNVDSQQLGEARNILSSFKNLRSYNSDPFEEWNYLRQETCALWNTFFN
jgi:hypothetical protein